MIIKNIALTAPLLLIVVGFQFYVLLELNDKVNQLTPRVMQSRLIPFESDCTGLVSRMPVLHEFAVPEQQSQGRRPSDFEGGQVSM